MTYPEFKGRDFYGDWVYGGVFYTDEKAFIIQWNMVKRSHAVLTEVERKTLSVNTGAMDEESTFIFTNDVIRLKNKSFIVKYDKLKCAYVCEDVKDSSHTIPLADARGKCKVIGNKFDIAFEQQKKRGKKKKDEDA